MSSSSSPSASSLLTRLTSSLSATSTTTTSSKLLTLLSGAVIGIVAVHVADYLCHGRCPFWCVKKDGACPVTGKIGRCPYASSSSSSSTALANIYKKKPIVVTITGSAGQIGYAILFRIAAGRMLGEDQPIELRLLEVPPCLPLLRGVVMELDDCAFPLVTKVVATDDLAVAFKDCDIALLIGARPRSGNMTRADLLKANAPIFEAQGKALNQYASRNVKVLVVGNPANQNARIAMEHAPNLPKSAFTAMTRLDQLRAVARVAEKANVRVGDVKNVVVWGNHSDSMYPDLTFGTVRRDDGREVSILEAVNGDETWAKGEFVSAVQNRGKAVIDAMGKSSAASAANAAIEHVRSWVVGTRPGEWVSMAVCSTGEYGVPKGLIFSFPCTCANGEYTIVQGLESQLSEFAREKLRISWQQLQDEHQMYLTP